MTRSASFPFSRRPHRGDPVAAPPRSAASRWLGGALVLLCCVAAPAFGAHSIRVQATQHGNFVMVGNTLAHDCRSTVPVPVVGTVGSCGSSLSDTAPAGYWRADDPANGQARADASITPANARSTAMLSLPAGAQVTHAYLYWAGNRAAGADTSATFDRRGGFNATVNATQSWTNANQAYLSMADVTTLVAANGNGSYRITGVDTDDLRNLDDDTNFHGWWMVVLYELGSEPLRTLTVYDGLEVVDNGAPQNFSLSGFRLPMSGFDARLGVVALEGDDSLSGDKLIFNGNALSDGNNPQNNFFNASHTANGAAVSTAGDLPQTSGTGGSLSGLDIDLLDVTARMSGGQTSASVSATSTQDVYYLASMVVGFTTFRPDFGNSSKSVVDLDGGALLPGDTLEYTLVVNNQGNETATLTTLEDALPTGISYVPNSLVVVSGPNAGAKTDAAGDDQADYRTADRTVVFRLGSGANASQGGQLALAQETRVRFRAKVDAGCGGQRVVSNQARVRTTGQSSGSAFTFLTDGDPNTPGTQTTDIALDAQCLGVQVQAGGQGSISSSPAGIAQCTGTCTASFATHAIVTLSATPAAGFRFAQWGGDCSGTSTQAQVTMDGARNCTAQFAIGTHTLTYRAGANGSIGGTAIQTVNHGGTGSPVNAIAAAHHHFTQWSDGSTANPRTETQVVADLDVTAAFAIDTHTVGGSITGLTGNGLVIQLNGGHDLLPGSGATGFVFADALAYGTSYIVTLAAQPAGQNCTVANGSGTVGDADIGNIAIACVALQSALTLTVDDNSDYARYGRFANYVVTLTNSGNTPAQNVHVSALLSPAFDLSATQWQCFSGGSGATCTPQGNGALDDTVTVQGGRSVTWTIHATVFNDSPLDTGTVQISATGASSVSDTDLLVIFRDGSDTPYANGTELPASVARSVLEGEASHAFALPAPSARMIDRVLLLTSGASTVEVQVLNLGAERHVRLVQLRDGRETATPWTSAATDARLVIASVKGDSNAREVLVEGAAQSIRQTLTASP